MRSHLKVKVTTMGMEMSFIRKQEAKWKRKARYARQKQKDAAVEYCEKNFWSNRHHRSHLKTEVRTAGLAYGFMKGRSYRQMEHLCYGALKGYGQTEPNWAAIESTVLRFCKHEDTPQDWMQRFSEWLENAKVWFEGNPERITTAKAAREAEYLRCANDPLVQDARAYYRQEMKAKYKK